jgi:CRISPR-associated protein Csd1
MILQALKEYYDRKTHDGGTELAPAGFEPKEIPFVIVLDQNGNFIDLEDTRDGDGKKKTGQIRFVPQGVKRSGKNSWQTAYLLWDHIGYVFGYAEDDPERAQKQHESFIGRIRQAFPEPDADEGVSAVLTFLERADFQLVYQHSYWDEMQKIKGNISFRLLNDIDLICQRPAVRAAVEHIETTDAVQQRCLISGENEVIERLHPSIKGVWGAQTSGANIVSFNLDAFNSYGKTQGFNAPIGQKTAFAYTSALNHLLRKGSRQRLQVGDASAVFWAEKEHPLEDDFLALFEADRDDPDRNINAVRTLYRAPEAGTGHISDDDTRFYVLGLAPNAARIAIRFWHYSTVSEIAGNMRQHFDDLRIVHGPRDPEFLSLSRLLESTALQEKRDHIPPNLAGDFMRAILSGTPYPWTLLTAAIRRIRAEQRLTYPRAASSKQCSFGTTVRINRRLTCH